MPVSNGIVIAHAVLYFMLGIAFLTFAVRNAVEVVFPKAPWRFVWRERILPLLPALLGACFALVATKYPYPDGITSASSRFFFGLSMGGASSWGYKIVRARLMKATGVSLLSEPPSSGTPASRSITFPGPPPLPKKEKGEEDFFDPFTKP